MQVILRTNDSAKAGVEAGPGVAAAREHAELLHPDLERSSGGSDDALIDAPPPVCAICPDGIEMGGHDAVEIVAKPWALDDVAAVGMRIEPVEDRRQGTRPEEHVAVEAADDVGARRAEDELTGADARAPEGYVVQRRKRALESVDVGVTAPFGGLSTITNEMRSATSR
ncbi:MAG TPA: hypothetical protein VGO80_03265 [Solirubrobacteraceae bacterium]|nr:hypothetical protein [Solirubrobacteraceae bacterium]